MFRYLRRSRTISSVQAILDSYFGYTSLLLNGETTTTPFTSDASANNLQVAPVGTVRNDTFSPFNVEGNYSVFFNGTTDYFQLPFSSAYVLNSASSFTVECWVNLQSAVASTILSMRDGTGATAGWEVGTYSAAPQIPQISWDGTGKTGLLGTTNIALNTWTHLAFTYDGTTLRYFKNGVMESSATSIVTSSATSQNLFIGLAKYTGTAIRFFPGNISNVRIVKGTAVYTANFTPSTTGLTAIANTSLLCCQSASFKDNSTNAFALTPGGAQKVSPSAPFAYTPVSASTYFNGGSTDYLSIPTNSLLSIGSASAWTFECWFNVTGSFSNIGIAGKGVIGSSLEWSLYIVNSSTIGFGKSSAVGISYAVPTMYANTWNHIAFSCAGNSLTVYLNGVTSTSGAQTIVATPASGSVFIGSGNWNIKSTFPGYLSNVRLVNGTAVYTSNFTPPTAPLTAVTNTALLTLQGPGPANNIGFIDSSANDLAIVASGAPTQGTFSPFSQTGWSTYFNGLPSATGNMPFVCTPASTNLMLGGTTSTIECWINLTAYDTSTLPHGGSTIFCFWGGPGLTHYYALMVNTGGTLSIIKDYSGATASGSTLPIALNTWYHIAAVIGVGGSNKFYVNGVDITSQFSDPTLGGQWPLNFTGATVALYAGTAVYAYSSYTYLSPFTGYISNLRVVRGTAVYTSNFAPPTAPLTAISGTQVLMLQNNHHSDNSGNNVALTPANDVSIQAVSPFEPATSWSYSANGGSMYFNGTTDWLTTAAVAGMGSGNWTMETWVNPASFSAAPNLIDFRTSSQGLYPNIGILTSGYPYLYINTASVLTSTVAVTLNAWSHIALVKSGSTTTIYVNGKAGGTYADTNTYLSSTGLTIGSSGFTSDAHGLKFTGYISNLRIVSGTAVYTAAFTPPTAPVTAVAGTQILLSGTNSGIANAASANDISTFGTASTSSVQKKFGTKSLYFNGTTDYLTAPISSAFKFAGDITVEAWIYLTVANSYNFIYDCRTSGTSPTGFFLHLNGARQLVFEPGNTPAMTTTVTVALSTWTHVAYVRKGSANTLYINGVVCTAPYSSTTNYTDGNCVIGKTNEAAANYFTGYIDDLRITNGVARYINGFIVATSAYGDSTANDPYFNYVSLLVHADGTTYMAPAFNNNVIVDSSSNSFTVSRTGTPTQGTFSPFSNNGWSFSCASTATQWTKTAYLALSGSTAYTIDFWINPSSYIASLSSVLYGLIASGQAASCWIALDSSGHVGITNAGSGYTSLMSASSVPVGSWTHVAITVSGANTSATGKVYLNGVLSTTVSNMTTTIADVGVNVSTGARISDNGYGFNGSLSNFRITNGSVLYSSNFTVPTVPPVALSGTSVLLFGTNTLVNQGSGSAGLISSSGSIQPTSPFPVSSSYNPVVNGGSLYFNGTTDSLNIALGATAFNLTGAFTVEAWVYLTANPAINSSSVTLASIVSYGASPQTSVGYEFDVQTGSGNSFSFIKTGGGGSITATYPVALNTWYHVAVVFNGTTGALYVNGVAQTLSSNTWAWTAPTTATLNVGKGVGYSGYNDYFPGYISNLRIVNGTAVYTASFTPPTAPLAITGNTGLLLNGVGAGIVDSTGKNDVVTVGTSKTQSAVVKYGTGAMSFNGSTDYLTVPYSSVIDFTTSAFTVEAWVYTTTTADQTVMYFSGNTSSYAALRVGLGTSNVYLLMSNNGTSWAVNSGNIGTAPVNTWHHLAVCKTGSSVYFFLNGVLLGTYALTGTPGAGTLYQIGAVANPSASTFMNGYIDDLRVTKGYARYTANFTAPTAALPNSTSSDANFGQVSLLLQGDIQQVVNKVAKNNVFVDSSANALTVTAAGNPTQGTFSPFSNSGFSTYFPNNGSSVDGVLYPYNSAFNLGANNFTVEAWVNASTLRVATTNVSGTIYGQMGNVPTNSNRGHALEVNSTNLTFYCTTTGINDINIAWSYTFLLGVWYHVAVVRNGNFLTGYVNGVSLGAQAFSYTIFSSTAALAIAGFGRYPLDNGYYSLTWAGYISNLRIVNGTAIYTANFTPSAVPLTAVSGTALLTCQNSRSLDNGPNKLVPTPYGVPSIQASTPFAVNTYSPSVNGGSVYFNGSTDYFTAPNGAGLNMGTGDFTIEFWLNLNALPSTYIRVLSISNTSVSVTADEGILFEISNTNIMGIGIQGASSSSGVVDNSTIIPQTWTHWAMVRSGVTLYLFKNGVAVGSNTSANIQPNFTASFKLFVGSWVGVSRFFNGYMSNLRIVKGTAVYTSAFTPSTAPLTAITNTQLLLNSTSGALVDAAGATDLVLVGAASIGSNSKFGTGALVIPNGGTDYAYVPGVNLNMVFGASDFTIELWMYQNALGTAQTLIDFRPVSTNGAYISLGLAATGAPTLYVNTAAQITSAMVISAATWGHVALSRNSGTTRLFVNGILAGTYADANTYLAGSGLPVIGTNGFNYSANSFNGALDEIRITKGIGRYTGNFAVPTAAFPTN